MRSHRERARLFDFCNVAAIRDKRNLPIRRAICGAVCRDKPPRNLYSPPLTDVAVGAVSEAWQYQELENGAATLDADMEGVAPAAAQVRASVIRQPTEKRVSLPKRRRPPWTPPTSSENLTTSGNTHTVAGRPSQKVRNATANVQNPTTGNGSAWAEALNDGGVDNASRPGQAVGAAGTLQNPAPGDALAMETTQASEEALRTRRVFRLSGRMKPRMTLATPWVF